jgi:hypothetical protein
MIGIEIKGEFLELPVGTTTQVDRNTPLALGDEIIGEYSFPFTFKASPHNMRLCGFINELGVNKSGIIKIAASYYENRFFAYKGTLVAEYAATNLNRPEEGEISVYFLAGISSFYQQAKNVLLKDIDLGGERLIPGLTFLQHAQSTWTKTSDESDYVFAPIYNPGFLRFDTTKYTNGDDVPEDVQPNFMNKIEYFMGETRLAVLPNINTMVPFIYLTYLLRRVFRQFGLTVTGDILQDPDFRKLFIDNYQALDWYSTAFNKEVKINLNRHVPQDWNVARFLLNLAKRYAFSYQFDFNNSTCRIVRLNEVPYKAARRDMTQKLRANIKLSFQTAQKIYGLIQKADEEDEMMSPPDLTEFKLSDPVMYVTDLPEPTEDNDNEARLVISTNQYYVCKYDQPSDPVFYWANVGDNIYDYEPKNQTDSIETEITTINQILYVGWRPNSKALFPCVKRPGNAGVATSQIEVQVPEIPSVSFGKPSETGYTKFGMRLLYYHGMRFDTYEVSEGGTQVLYPFASPHIFDTLGIKVGNYSAAYSGYSGINQEAGLLSAFWYNWLKVLTSQEAASFTLLLKLHEYLQLQWEEILLLRNVPYILTRIQIDSPFNPDSRDCSAINCEALRII